MSEGAALRDYSSCVHGLGHGLMMQAEGGTADGFGGGRLAARPTQNPPPAQPSNLAGRPGEAGLHGELEAPLLLALDACAAGPSPAESCQCASGVFMQVREGPGVAGGHC
jgi:hypothetical protein